MTSDPFLLAAAAIPAGQTRSFKQLAAMAGRPGAARAAGRALAGVPLPVSLEPSWRSMPTHLGRVDDEGSGAAVPWHRVVSSRGALARDPQRAAVQLARLRAEHARPAQDESVPAWAARVATPFVGQLATGEFAAADDAVVAAWPAELVEALPDVAAARERGLAAVAALRDELVQDGDPGSVPDAAVPALADWKRPGGLAAQTTPLAQRLERQDWAGLRGDLLGRGLARVPSLFSPAECADLLASLAEIERGGGFERSVQMAPHGFGVGAYHYLSEPLLDPAAALRTDLYARLAPAGLEVRGRVYPPDLDTFWAHCRRGGQRRASSIVLCYGAGGVNHPHRDLYGEVWFPFQALLVLSRHGRDFEGGEFVLVEDAASGGRETEHVVPATEGDLLLFASRCRVELDGRRRKRVFLRHGMRPVTRGMRFGLGIVFHLAR